MNRIKSKGLDLTRKKVHEIILERYQKIIPKFTDPMFSRETIIHKVWWFE